MLDSTELLLVFVIGLATGFVDSTVGGGGLISVPSLIFLGLPPQIAIATDRFGTIGQSLTATYKFWKAKKIVWKYVPILVVLSLVGSVIGANLLVKTGPDVLQKVIGVLLIAMLLVVLFKKDLGTQRGLSSRPKIIAGLGLLFLLGIYGGFFAQGTGPILLFVMTYFLGLTIIEAMATKIIPWLVLSVSSVIIFALNDIINYKVGVVLLISMAIGGYVGAHMALEKGDEWVKRVFAVFVIVASLKLLF